METDYTTLEDVHCNLCGGREEGLLFIKDGFRIVRCNFCGLMYVNPRLKKEYLQMLYSEDYYRISAEDSIGYRDYEADKQYHAENSRRLIQTIEHYTVKGRLLDIGCSMGFFLEEAKGQGWDVYGTELSDYARRKARERGLNVFSEDVDFEDNFFDVVTCLGTIEHLPDPAAAMRRINHILKDDGLFVLSTPDAGGLIGGRRFQYKPKEHLYYFTRATIKKILRKKGFKILVIQGEWLKKPIYFVLERFRYYFPKSSGVVSGLESVLRRLGVLNLGVKVPTGQMVVYAKKD